MPHATMRSPAWLLSGLTHSVAGELTLANGHLVFQTQHGDRIFDAAIDDISDVTFPWYYFGGGLTLRIGTRTYRVSFTRPGNLPEHSDAEYGDIRSGRRSGAAWKATLTNTNSGH